MTVRQVAAAGPQPGDTPFVGGLFLASRPRALLENLAPAKTRGLISRSAGRENVEQRLTEMLHKNGEEYLNELRDQARQLEGLLGLQDEFKVLDKLIGALLQSKDSEDLFTAPTAIAYVLGESYEPALLETF